MKPPVNRNQNFSSSDRTKIIIVSVLLGLGILVLIILLGFLFLQNGFQLLAPATSTLASASVAPTAFVSTVSCDSQTFVLGATTFQIQNLTPAPDGSLTLPANTPGAAYWIEGTNTNYVFMLSSTPDNLAFQTALQRGDLATIYWADCTAMSFTISAIEANDLSNPGLLDQSVPGITVFVQTDPDGKGFVIKGSSMEPLAIVTDTPVPAGVQAIEAEIGLIGTEISSDKITIRIGVSILNYGASSFTISASDVSLTQQDGTLLNMASSEPPLPKEIASRATETIYFTFLRPASPTATLKVLTVEYDIEGY